MAKSRGSCQGMHGAETGGMNMKRRGRAARQACRGVVRLGVGALVLGLAVYVAACGEDDPAVQPSPDGGAADNGAPPLDSDKPLDDGGADTAKVCLDTPVDCSATAADGGVDAGGSEPVGLAGSVPVQLRCTGLYSCWSDKTIAATTHREYAPAFQLWSDGAEKKRWVVLPPGSTIDTGEASSTTVDTDGGTVDEWVFPVGTMVYKEFKLGGKRVETRRIWKASATEWVYSVWRWSDDESSATLMNAGQVLPNAAKAGAMYEIPSNTSCANCHDGHRDKFLSLDAWGLAAPGATGVTLAQLKAAGTLPKWTGPTSFAVPQDSTGKLDKAIGFYYNNCSFCHKPGRPGGASGLHLHLPVAAALPTGGAAGGGLPDGGAGLVHTETPLYKTAVDVAHTNAVGGLFPLGTWKRVTKGNAALSVLPGRDGIRDPDGGIGQGQMPNVLSRVFDPTGVDQTKEWINALPQ